MGGRGLQAIYPGAQAYVAFVRDSRFGDALMVKSLLCLGEPGEESSLFSLEPRLRPLFAEFGRDLSATAHD
jgi:hypothetical protein